MFILTFELEESETREKYLKSITARNDLSIAVKLHSEALRKKTMQMDLPKLLHGVSQLFLELILFQVNMEDSRGFIQTKFRAKF